MTYFKRCPADINEKILMYVGINSLMEYFNLSCFNVSQNFWRNYYIDYVGRRTLLTEENTCKDLLINLHLVLHEPNFFKTNHESWFPLKIISSIDRHFDWRAALRGFREDQYSCCQLYLSCYYGSARLFRYYFRRCREYFNQKPFNEFNMWASSLKELLHNCMNILAYNCDFEMTTYFIDSRITFLTVEQLCFCLDQPLEIHEPYFKKYYPICRLSENQYMLEYPLDRCQIFYQAKEPIIDYICLEKLMDLYEFSFLMGLHLKITASWKHRFPKTHFMRDMVVIKNLKHIDQHMLFKFDPKSKLWVDSQHYLLKYAIKYELINMTQWLLDHGFGMSPEQMIGYDWSPIVNQTHSSVKINKYLINYIQSQRNHKLKLFEILLVHVFKHCYTSDTAVYEICCNLLGVIRKCCANHLFDSFSKICSDKIRNEQYRDILMKKLTV